MTGFSAVSAFSTLLLGVVGVVDHVGRRARNRGRPHDRRLVRVLHPVPGAARRARSSRSSRSAARSPRPSRASSESASCATSSPEDAGDARPRRPSTPRRRGSSSATSPSSTRRTSGAARGLLRGPAGHRRRRWWARPAPARARSSASSRPSTGRPPGWILVDGRDLARVRLSDYRTQIGVVFQDNFLFDGTVFENIAYSRPEAPREAVLRAAAIARCDEFVEKLPTEVRHDRRRARRQALGRPAPARRDRAGDPGRPAHPDPRRGHLLSGQRERGRSSRRAWPS